MMCVPYGQQSIWLGRPLNSSDRGLKDHWTRHVRGWRGSGRGTERQQARHDKRYAINVSYLFAKCARVRLCLKTSLPCDTKGLWHPTRPEPSPPSITQGKKQRKLNLKHSSPACPSPLRKPPCRPTAHHSALSRQHSCSRPRVQPAPLPR